MKKFYILILSILFITCNKVNKIEDTFVFDTLSVEQQIKQISNQAENISINKLKLTTKEFSRYVIKKGDFIEIVNDGTVLDSLIINADSVTIVANNLAYMDKPILTKYPNKIIIDGKNKTNIGILVNGKKVTLINFSVINCRQVGVRWNGEKGYAANGNISKIGFNYFNNTDSILFSNQSGFRIYGEGTVLNNIDIDSTAFDACGIGVSGVVIKNSKFTNVALAGHSNGDGIQLYENVVPNEAVFTLTDSYIEVKSAVKHCLLGHDRKILAFNNILSGGSSGIIAGAGSIIKNNTIKDQLTNSYTNTIGRGIILMSLDVICEENILVNDDTGILVKTVGVKPELEFDNEFINCLYKVRYK